MGRVKKGFDTVAAVLRKHIWCVMIIVFIIIIFTMAVTFVSKDNEVAAYMGFAASFVSIALAFVVIVHTFLSMADMNDLVDRVGKSTTEKVDLVVNQVRQMQNILPKSPMSSPVGEKLDLGQAESEDLVMPNIDGWTPILLLPLYALVKSYELEKEMSIIKITDWGTPKISTAFGIFYTLQSFWGMDSMGLSGKEQFVKKIPDGFAAEVRKNLDKQSDDDLKHQLEMLDEYFAKLE